MEEYKKLGYLNDRFHLFHLKNTYTKEFESHYHDFDKILIFLQGDVQYTIEGKSYQLKPYDIVLVNHNDIHRPVIQSPAPYERIIVYISPSFLETYKTKNYNLGYCFEKAKLEHSNVLRLQSFAQSPLYKAAKRLEHSFESDAYANELYKQVLFLEFMILLNRSALQNQIAFIDTQNYNPKIVDLLEYLNTHLTEDLNIDLLSAQFFISKYYMMRLFKSETGYTINNYISQKRLLLAKELLSEGYSITQACFDSGFRDYTSFSRAYKRFFHETPRMTKKGAENF